MLSSPTTRVELARVWYTTNFHEPSYRNPPCRVMLTWTVCTELAPHVIHEDGDKKTIARCGLFTLYSVCILFCLETHILYERHSIYLKLGVYLLLFMYPCINAELFIKKMEVPTTVGSIMTSSIVFVWAEQAPIILGVNTLFRGLGA